MNRMSPTKPITSGERIWADDQGKLMPPKVKAIVTEQVEVMTKKFPLKLKVRLFLLTRK
jgi:hypothetical protein